MLAQRAETSIMTRQWFQDKDGTYYRNCPLIMDERLKAIDEGKLDVASILKLEWDQAWHNTITKTELEECDVVVKGKDDPIIEPYLHFLGERPRRRARMPVPPGIPAELLRQWIAAWLDREPRRALEHAERAAQRYIPGHLGTCVAAVLSDHCLDEEPDPNINELAHTLLMMNHGNDGR
jgi:hypothetical protein